MTDNKIFKMVSFSPIGFKMINYPTQFCLLCRGHLNEVCSVCMENRSEKCNIINDNDSYYHNHCFILMNSKKTNNVSN